MQLPKLTPRLTACAEFVSNGACVIDVGTDHAYLPIWLYLTGKISSAIASDIHAEPLERAEVNIRKYGLSAQISTALGDGLSTHKDTDCDTVIIAGMGGDTICHILRETPWAKEKTLILQPMTNSAKLRRFLRENGYIIVDETLAREERRLYSVMKVTAGEMPDGDVYDHISRPLLFRGGDDCKDYLKGVISSQKKVLGGIMATGADSTKQQSLLDSLTSLLDNM